MMETSSGFGKGGKIITEFDSVVIFVSIFADNYSKNNFFKTILCKEINFDFLSGILSNDITVSFTSYPLKFLVSNVFWYLW